MTIDIFYLNDNGTRSPAIAPFYESSNGLYSLTNFSKDAVTIDGKKYASTEVYFQREKFKGNATILANFDRHVTTAGEALKFARDNSKSVDPQWHTKNKFIAMERALREKLKQHPEIAKQLKDTGDACLVEDTTSSINEEAIWGWGRKDGTNHLGLLWMKLRNELFEQEGRNRLIVNPQNLYKQVQDIRSRVLPRLVGVNTNNAYPCMQILERTNPALIEKASPAPTNTATTSSRPITSSSTDPQTTRHSAIVQDTIQDQIALATGFKDNITKLERAKNQKPGEPDVLKITFNDETQAKNFATSVAVQQNSKFRPLITPNRQQQLVVILTQDIAIHYLQNLSLGNSGVKLWNDLKQPTVGNKRPRSPSIPITTTSSSYLPRTQTSSSTDPQTPATNVYNPDPTSAHGKVLAATGSNGWITDLKIAPNLNPKDPPVLKITFCSNIDAAAFINANSKPVREGGPGLILPKSKNPSVVILPKSEAEKFFAYKGISKHGISQRNTWSSLEWEENNSNNNNPKRPRPSM